MQFLTRRQAWQYWNDRNKKNNKNMYCKVFANANFILSTIISFQNIFLFLNLINMLGTHLCTFIKSTLTFCFRSTFLFLKKRRRINFFKILSAIVEKQNLLYIRCTFQRCWAVYQSAERCAKGWSCVLSVELCAKCWAVCQRVELCASV